MSARPVTVEDRGSDLPDPTRAEGTPHPRETARIFGQDAAAAGFLEAFNTGRLHHAWLLTGPQGIGKATLAWQIARFLLHAPPPGDAGLFGAPPPATSLEIPPDSSTAHQVAALSHPGLFVLRRMPNDKGDRISAEIRVDDVRKMRGFFQLSAAEGGRRVVIVDAADEMNPAAANALLKLLEEPPAHAVLLLIAHQPSRLLPTIRSRCRELRLAPLGPEALQAALDQAGIATGGAGPGLAELAAGSAGKAARLVTLEGLDLYARLVGVFGPRGLDRQAAIALAEKSAARGQEAQRALLAELTALLLARLARTGAAGPLPEAVPGEAALLARLSPDAHAARLWAAAGQEIPARLAHGLAVNLDPAALVLDTVFSIQKTAQTRP